MGRNEKKLIADILSNSPRSRSEAIREVCNDNYKKVELFVCNNSGTAEDAKDIFQDGVSVFFQNLKNNRFKGSSSVGTYLFGICKNLWYEELRRVNMERESLKVDIDLDNTYPNLSLLKKVLDLLKEDCQSILTKFYYEKKSIDDLRLQLGMNSNQVVKNKKARCLSYLMNIIQQNNIKKESFYNE